MEKNYYVKICDDWHLFQSVVDLKDLVLTVADFTSLHDDVIVKAISGLEEMDCIKLYNMLASNYEVINGVWELGDHIFGDHE